MGVGDLSFSAIYSLKTIDTWLAVLNANAAGTSKVGFRGTKLKFGGDSITQTDPFRSPKLPARTGEQTLTIAQTAVRFDPAATVVSAEPTHFAIEGKRDHFFVVDDRIDHTTTSTGAGQDPNTYLLTRDGQFHWGPQEADGNYYLRNSLGHYVVNATQGFNFANGAVPGELVRTNNPILFDALTTTFELTPGVIQAREPALLEPSDDFGSAYFKFPGINKVAGDPLDPTGDPIDGRNRFLQQFALEGSNTTLTEVVPQLALAQKFYSAVATLIKVTNANVDETLRLIR